MRELGEIVAAWEQARNAGKDCLLATVVQIQGSTYRRPGARMLVTDDGWQAGSISGGCLEGDILKKAWWRTEDGAPALVTYDSTDEDDVVWGFGLGCNGVVQVLLERLVPGSPTNPVEFLVRCLRERRRGLLATIIRAEGQTGASLGRRLLMWDTEEATDNLRDDAIRHLLQSDAAEILVAGRAETRRYVLPGGELDVFFEVVMPPLPLMIFGAGHDAVPLAGMAKELGWHVTVVDTHSTAARPQRFPQAHAVMTCAPDRIAESLTIDPRTAVVLMTHSYPQDRLLLPQLLASSAFYIGLLGPKRRAERLLAEMDSAKTGQDRLHAPIGLDIGADTPEQIALSIVAEIQAAHAGRGGGCLRERDAPIYDRTAPGTIRAQQIREPVACTLSAS